MFALESAALIRARGPQHRARTVRTGRVYFSGDDRPGNNLSANSLVALGFLFVFHRVTGEPVWPIEERPVPQSDVPGERTPTPRRLPNPSHRLPQLGQR